MGGIVSSPSYWTQPPYDVYWLLLVYSLKALPSLALLRESWEFHHARLLPFLSDMELTSCLTEERSASCGKQFGVSDIFKLESRVNDSDKQTNGDVQSSVETHRFQRRQGT